MNPQDSSFAKILKKMKSSDFIYLCVIFVVFVVVVILFFYSTNFIVKNINKIFAPVSIPTSLSLDKARYSLVAKKLNLPVNSTPVSDVNQNVDAPPADETTATSPASIPQNLDKGSITINILNSTAKKGVAATLAKTFSEAGFATATTGNEEEDFALTTILINNDKKEFLPLIEEVVIESYPKAISEVVSSDTEFDVTIIIGQQ
jgi:LytR cell envelope-related transcriptional attenuator